MFGHPLQRLCRLHTNPPHQGLSYLPGICVLRPFVLLVLLLNTFMERNTFMDHLAKHIDQLLVLARRSAPQAPYTSRLRRDAVSTMLFHSSNTNVIVRGTPVVYVVAGARRDFPLCVSVRPFLSERFSTTFLKRPLAELKKPREL